MKRIAVVAGLLILVASGCSKGSGSKGGGPDGVGGPARAADTIRMSETGAAFVGKCQKMQFLGDTVYAKVMYNFSKETARSQGVPPFTEQVEFFSDSGCKDEIQTTVGNGDYGFSPDGMRALVTFSTMLVVPQDEEFASKLNARAYCGISGWKAGVGRDISREGNCWDSVKSGSYLIQLQTEDDEDGETGMARIYNCPDRLAAVPSADCVSLEMIKAE